MNSNNPPKRILLAYKEGARDEADAVAEFLRNHDAEVLENRQLGEQKISDCLKSGRVDTFIALGGDGSMLSASHLCAKSKVPILGINMGSFGFLMELQKNDWREYLPRLLKGDFRLEERMLLLAQLWHGKTLKQTWEVVNEVVICRGRQVKPIHLFASVDGYAMSSYVADGLIVSTPTGSTAYALAAGGAILPPELRNMLVVPVAPHLSLDRAIILSEGSTVTITAGDHREVVLSADGYEAVPLERDDIVKVETSPNNIRFIRFHNPGYFYRHLNRYIEQNPSTTSQ